jgi:periplasmic divalent cation tolerance protein
MAEIILVYSLFPSAGEAHDCCRKLLDEGLIACANRLAPAISHYRLEGELETAEEHPVIFKTSAALEARVIERISELHRHKVPAVLSWPASAANPAFADWVGSTAKI